MSQPKKISTLVLIRHGQSQWNKENLFTGWKDPDLTEKGIEEAINAGQKIKQTNINFDLHFTSKLKRAQRTGNLIMKELGKDINTFDDDQLCDIAWEYILKNPKDYRTCEPDYDNENILEQSITEED